ncbi:MAG: HAD-IC family P-type ATPase [Dermatophilaceae bacterium]
MAPHPGSAGSPQGLTAAQVRERTAAGETNRAEHSTTRPVWDIVRANLFTFFNNLLFVIGAALIVLGQWNDAVTTVGLGLVNALIGMISELRAKRTLDAITVLARTQVSVLREGAEARVDPDEIVRGDVVVASPGDQVVVDGVVVGTDPLGIDESLLTGEADVLTKVPGDTVLSGSVVANGRGYYEATAVGEHSYAHRLTATVRAFAPSRTPLQRQVDLVVRAVTLVVALMSFAILFQALLESFALTRIVQVSAVLSGQIPYGLFFIVALAYATGAATLAKRGALVQQTNAVESLANVDTVCLDKTGTLTANRLEVAEVVAFSGSAPVPADSPFHDEVCRLLGTFARSTQNPNATTTALATGLPGEPVTPHLEVAFSSTTKWSAQSLPEAALGEHAAQWATLVLGAPELLAAALGPGAEAFAPGGVAAEQQRVWAAGGLRVLLLAASSVPVSPPADPTSAPSYTPVGLTPLALVAMREELRPHALATLRTLADAGIDLKIISGDDPRTVAALALQAGLGPTLQLVTGPELDAMSDRELAEAARTGTVFGRATPAHKERLVTALRASGRYVAMVGDGTNDALSLKKADLGIAMESGSPVTRNVADMVLLADSFAAVAPALVEGRRIVDGLTKSLFLFIPRVLTSILVIVFVTMLGLGFPYSPAQVALTLFTVGIPSLALTLWARPDRPPGHLLRRVISFSVPAAIVTGVAATSIYTFFYQFVGRGLASRDIPLRAAERWSAYTGVDITSSDFANAAGTIVAQTAMSSFTSFAAFLLLLLIEPPTRFFSGWAPVSPDKRPGWLAAGLFVTYLVVLLVPRTANYFGLLTPGGPELLVLAAVLPVWFFALRTIWRRRWFDRFLGLG